MTRDGPLWLVIVAVSTGASLGACIRWGLSYWLNSKAVWIPLGTLTANLSAGFLGGLSTLSTFSAENLAYLMQGELLEALEHIGIHTCGTIFATWVGYSLLTNWL